MGTKKTDRIGCVGYGPALAHWLQRISYTHLPELAKCVVQVYPEGCTEPQHTYEGSFLNLQSWCPVVDAEISKVSITIDGWYYLFQVLRLGSNRYKVVSFKRQTVASTEGGR